MTETSIPDLVRRDLIWFEKNGLGTAYLGRSAILDAYEAALEQVCFLRQFIEEMTIGDLDIRPGTPRTQQDQLSEDRPT